MFESELHRRYKHSKLLFLLGLLLLFSVIGMRQGLASSAEVWVGVVDDPIEGQMSAEFTNKPDKFTLHYGVPRSCRLECERILDDGKQMIFRFSESSGGFCDSLYKGTMTIDKSDQDRWSTRVEKKSTGFIEKFSLRKKLP